MEHNNVEVNEHNNGEPVPGNGPFIGPPVGLGPDIGDWGGPYFYTPAKFGIEYAPSVFQVFNIPNCLHLSRTRIIGDLAVFADHVPGGGLRDWVVGIRWRFDIHAALNKFSPIPGASDALGYQSRLTLTLPAGSLTCEWGKLDDSTPLTRIEGNFFLLDDAWFRLIFGGGWYTQSGPLEALLQPLVFSKLPEKLHEGGFAFDGIDYKALPDTDTRNMIQKIQGNIATRVTVGCLKDYEITYLSDSDTAGVEEIVRELAGEAVEWFKQMWEMARSKGEVQTPMASVSITSLDSLPSFHAAFSRETGQFYPAVSSPSPHIDFGAKELHSVVAAQNFGVAVILVESLNIVMGLSVLFVSGFAFLGVSIVCANAKNPVIGFGARLCRLLVAPGYLSALLVIAFQVTFNFCTQKPLFKKSKMFSLFEGVASVPAGRFAGIGQKAIDLTDLCLGALAVYFVCCMFALSTGNPSVLLRFVGSTFLYHITAKPYQAWLLGNFDETNFSQTMVFGKATEMFEPYLFVGLEQSFHQTIIDDSYGLDI